MAWLKALLIAIQLAWNELERHRAKARQIRRDDRRGVISEQPTEANRELFGPSAGRVYIDADATKSGADVRSNTTKD